MFKEQVRPILIKHCLDCHGGKTTKGDFDLSDRKPLVESGTIEGGREGGASSYALMTRARRGAAHAPQGAPKLPDAERSTRIARWIDLGAPYDRPLIEKKAGCGGGGRRLGLRPPDADRNFWSFRPLRADRAARGEETKQMGENPDRSLHPRRTRREGLDPEPGRRSPRLDSPGHVRPDRSAANTGGGRCLCRRPIAGGLRGGGRSSAGVAPFWRALGTALDGRGPVRGVAWLRARL